MVLVIIDGLDASGKSTQALRLLDYFRNQGKIVCLRAHPSDDNFFGAETRKLLYSRGKSAHYVAALFYTLDVAHSILLYSWRRYDYLIFVRYLMGTSYLPRSLFDIAYEFFASIVPTSDFMFFLDVTPKEAFRRIRQTREKQEMFESLEELTLIRRRALSLVERGKWTIINADKPVREVEKEILKSLNKLKLELR